MLKTTFYFSLTSLLLFCSFMSTGNAQGMSFSRQPQTVLANRDQVLALGGEVLAQDPESNLAVSRLSHEQLGKLLSLNHFIGRCGGFEALSEAEAEKPQSVIDHLLQVHRNMQVPSPLQESEVQWNQDYQNFADQAQPESLKETVVWISSYQSRNDKLSDPNRHVIDLKSRLQTALQGAKWPFTLELIEHIKTRQKSLRLRVIGTSRPQEVIVLGAHFDSVNHSFFGSQDAPGADDNGSGSANLIEALKILAQAEPPQRTWEFYWYAAEESGLLGSAEIAKAARAEQKDVVAVLQLDMTLYPGSGEQVIGLVNDFTSPWLRGVLTQINAAYVKARFVDDQCGYACSDHASWHRQNYHAVVPFEATTQTMNRNIHTEKDLIDSKSSFSHSNSFTKFAILFALTLGNSELRPPTALSFPVVGSH